MKNKLKELREEKGFTLNQLSYITGFSATQLNRIENGLASFTEKQIISLSTFFDVSADYLLGIACVKNYLGEGGNAPVANKIDFTENLSDYSLTFTRIRSTGMNENKSLFWFQNTETTKTINDTSSFYFDEINLLVSKTDNLNDILDSSLIVAIVPEDNLKVFPDLFTLYRPRQFEANEIFLVKRLSTGEMIELNPARNKKDYLLIGLIIKMESLYLF